jgi:hypothetical protein
MSQLDTELPVALRRAISVKFSRAKFMNAFGELCRGRFAFLTEWPEMARFWPGIEGADISVAQQLAGHASVRRGDTIGGLRIGRGKRPID